MDHFVRCVAEDTVPDETGEDGRPQQQGALPLTGTQAFSVAPDAAGAPRIRGPSAAAALPRQRTAATKRRGTSQFSAVGFILTLRMLSHALTNPPRMLPSGEPPFMPGLYKGGAGGATTPPSPFACP